MDTVLKEKPMDSIVQVTIYTGAINHLLDKKYPQMPDTQAGREYAMCGYRPFWPGVWTEVEGGKPICKTCIAIREARYGDS